MLAVTESIFDSSTEGTSDPSIDSSSDSDEDDRGLGARISTIYPDDQGANRDPPLEVEHQRSFTGPYIIPDSLADQRCDTLGVHGLLSELNEIMGTSFPLSPPLEFHLTICISLDYDFGLAYSYLRLHWKSDFDTLAARMSKAESDDAALRRDALDPSKRYITKPRLPPRRVWDLFSNRVIPYYWWGGDLLDSLPVSHSWVAENERSAIRTSINGNKWPVPVPDDSSLERVRIELLNYAESSVLEPEYSWLDVLCLRQAGDVSDEAQRLEEWTTDVPTIGYIYNHTFVDSKALVYFNGLGRPFHSGGYADNRHWFSRTWTVQEAVSHPLLGGATPSSPTLSLHDSESEPREFYVNFRSVFGRAPTWWLRGLMKPVFSQYVTLMRERHATNPRDRISGLASIARPKRLPVHDPTQSTEDAWEVLVKVIGKRSRAHLFFWYPGAGNIRRSWVPSWSQVMSENTPAADGRIEGFSEIHYDKARDEFHGRNFRVLDLCLVLGLDSHSLRNSLGRPVARTGTVIGKDPDTEAWQQHEVSASHQIAIDEDIRYTLLFNEWSHRLVIGVRIDVGEFRKLCVLDFVSEGSTAGVKSIGSRQDVVLI